MLINGIVAMDKNKGIGKNNNLPWTLNKDLKHFQNITTGNGNNAIIIGRNTWNSIKFLKGRDHLILSKTLKLNYSQDGKIIKSFSDITELLKFLDDTKYDKIWVIGGSQIYKKFLELSLINELYIKSVELNTDAKSSVLLFIKLLKLLLKFSLRDRSCPETDNLGFIIKLVI